MYFYQSLFVPVYEYRCVLRRCLALGSRRLADLVSIVCSRVNVGHVTAAVSNSARLLLTSQPGVVE